MRMWMVNPEWMCNKHLCGEHVELHMFVGTIRKRKHLFGYVKNNCLEFKSIKARHSALVKEMQKRNMVHCSPLGSFDGRYLTKIERESVVDEVKSQEDLMNRCLRCKGLWMSEK